MSDLAQTLARLAAILGHPDGEPVALDGGITNRNYKVGFGGTPYVIREPGKDTELLGIDRGAEWAASCAAARAGVGPPVRVMLEDPPILVTGFVEGRPVSEDELRQPDLLRNVAGALRRIHDSEEKLPSTFSAFRTVEDYAATATARGAKVPDGYNAARKRAKAIEKALRGPEHEPVPCHNDLLATNLLLDGATMCIVDWEYAGMGNRYFDLGNLSVNNGLDEDAQATLLEAYFGEPPDARRLACLRLMQFMSDFRESMWGVVQGAVSELDFDFEGYAVEHFERLRETAADPRFRTWLKEARAAHA
ncbi:MAG: phosphotransferase [Actinomycetota bacterium]